MGNFPARAVGAEKENIMKKKLVAAFTAAVLGSAVLAGCGSSSSSDTAATTAATAAATEAAADTASTAADTASTETAAAADGDTTITVAASQTPHSEILEQAKSILADEGYDLEVTVFED